MMIARWTVEARFGKKPEAFDLLRQWFDQIGSQTDIDVSTVRILGGSVGVGEAVLEVEFDITGLADLQSFFDKIATIRMHSDWGREMGEVIVSGSARWTVFRVLS